jgi:hypothetical protein
MLSFLRLGNFFPHSAILNWPVEDSVLLSVSVFGDIHHFELVLQTMDVDRFCRLSPFIFHDVDSFVKIFRVLRVPIGTLMPPELLA